MKFLKTLIVILLSITILLLTIWGALALYYQASPNDIIRNSIVFVFIVISIITFIITLKSNKLRYKILIIYTLVYITLLLWYSTITPSNSRQWQENVAVLSYATKSKNFVKVYNIRNFRYTSEKDYTASYYDKTFDIEKLTSVDLISVYWMGPSVAHVFLSFSFEGGEHLAISIEARSEVGESYSTVAGFFRMSELYYVVSDERDVIKLRTNYRKNPSEDVYMYSLNGSQDDAKKLFLAYIDRINSLKKSPEFYNTLTTNCTTNIWENAHPIADSLSFSWQILVSGYLVDYLYENDRLKAENSSFIELRKNAYINNRAENLNDGDDFSYEIRKR